MSKLTKRQSEILALIQAHITATGSPPTRAEIAKKMGFKSPNAAEDHLRALARKGAIELIQGTSRGIRLPREMGTPIVKKVSANQPILSESHIRDYSKIDRGLFETPFDFLYRVTGNQLQSLGILNGDYLAIASRQNIQNGQLGLIRSQSEITVRRFTADVQQQNPTVEGLVVGVVRPLTSSTLP